MQHIPCVIHAHHNIAASIVQIPAMMLTPEQPSAAATDEAVYDRVACVELKHDVRTIPDVPQTLS